MSKKKFTLSLIIMILLPLLLNGCMETPGGEIPPVSNKPLESLNDSDKRLIQLSPHKDESVIRVWRDFSKSGDEQIWTKNIDDFMTAVGRHKTEIAGIEVVRFAASNHSIWDEKAEKFIWGDYPTFKEFQVNYENAPPNVKLFQDARKKFEAEQREAYEKEKAQIVADYDVRTKSEFEKLRNYLMQSPTIPAGCTNFTELAARIKRESLTKNLTITDGWADCPEETEASVKPIEVAGKHSIIQLTVNSDDQASGKELEQRERFLHKLFPSAGIFPIYSIDRAVDELFK